MLAAVATPPALSMRITLSRLVRDIRRLKATGIGRHNTAVSVIALTAVSATNMARWFKQVALRVESQ